MTANRPGSDIKTFRNRMEMLDALPAGAVVGEVGVQLGDFAAAIWARCRPRLLVLIDGWEHFTSGPYALDKSNVDQATQDRHYREVLDRFRTQSEAGRVLVLRGRSETLLAQFPDRFFDWLYLDADHTTAAVNRDLLQAARLVRDDGLICGHDYVDRPQEGIEVKTTVDRFCAAHGWTIEMRTVDDDLCSGYDSYALRRTQLVGRPDVARG